MGLLGRGRVQICHKGAPGRDRPRRKARNINVFLRALRLDTGLCGRFGQSAASGRPGRAVVRLGGVHGVGVGEAPARRAVTDRADAPFDRAAPTRAPPGPRAGTPDPRDRHSTHENVPLADVLTGYPTISRVTRRSHGPPRRSPGAPHHRLSRMAGRRLACRDAADPFGSLACRWTTIFREPGSLFSGRLRAFPGKDIMMIHPHEA